MKPKRGFILLTTDVILIRGYKMKENIVSKYYFYAVTLFTYLILAFKNLFTKKKRKEQCTT